jgi:ABC-type antimicrobial peptide transport system permease subunit
MFKNYFKIAWRNLAKNKVYSSINIAGLATGIAVALLVGLWIWDELSFNSYHRNHSRLAQIMLNQTSNGEIYTDETIAMPLGEALRTGHAADFKYVSLSSWENEHTLVVENNKLPAAGRWVEPDFPEMFTLDMVNGNRDVLKDPSTILLAESTAKALFGRDNPINKTVKLDNKMDMKIGGVYKDLPHNSSFYETKILLPWGHKENWMNRQTSWTNHCGVLYVQLSDNADFNNTNTKIKNIPTPHVEKVKEEIMLHPIAKLNLYTKFENGKAAGGRIQFVWLFGIIGASVLLLACINFMNLSTARSEKRAKEVGIRKAMGSLRTQLIGQFLSESIFLSVLAFILALVLVQLSLPFFNGLAGKQMSLFWNSPLFWIIAFAFTLFTGIISGSYPAFYLSGFEPIKVLKGVFKAGRFASLPRKVFVVVQFSVSVILIIGTIIILRQIQYAKDRPTGFSRDGLISVPLTEGLYGKYNILRNDLLQTGVVENMAESSQPASHFSNNNSIEWRGKDPNLEIYFRNVNVTPEFGSTIGWEIKQGRDFSKDFLTDSGTVILNESAVTATGLKEPVGEIIKFGAKNYTVVGVAKDMLTQSPYDPMHPSVFFCEGWMGVVTIRMKPGISQASALGKIATVFRKYTPGNPFQYKFVDDEYAKKYSNEVRIGNLASFFAILAIFISCLGLFGLASFVAEQRTKEIGVRKVLGATVFNLWKMQSKEFVGLVNIACLIAIPVARYFLNQWLQNYNYRIEISWWIFAVAISGAVVITLLTVSFQAIKAAVANPVKSLRAE